MRWLLTICEFLCRNPPILQWFASILQVAADADAGQQHQHDHERTALGVAPTLPPAGRLISPATEFSLLPAARAIAPERPRVAGAAANPPGLRLPNPYKTAFSSADLFAQQANMQTHDMALQMILDVAHHAYTRLHRCQCSPAETVFTVNFGTPVTEAERVIVFFYTLPHWDVLNVTRSFQHLIREPGWVVHSQKCSQIYIFGLSNALVQEINTAPQPTADADEEQRPFRHINLD